MNVRVIEISNLKMNDSINNISLMGKLRVLRKAHTRSTMDNVAEEMDLRIPPVQNNTSQPSRITKNSTPTVSRRYLPLEDRLKVICRAEFDEKRSLICNDSKYHQVLCTEYSKGNRNGKPKAHNGSSLTILRACFPLHPRIDSELLQFISFSRNLRLSVSRSLMQECAGITARNLEITDFKGSNGYI